LYVCKCMFSSFLYCAPTSWPRAHHIVDVLLLAVWGCEQESFKFATEQCCWMAQFQLCQWLLPHTRRRHRKCSSPSFSVGLRTAKPWVNAQSADQAERDLRLASNRSAMYFCAWLTVALRTSRQSLYSILTMIGSQFNSFTSGVSHGCLVLCPVRFLLPHWYLATVLSLIDWWGCHYSSQPSRARGCIYKTCMFHLFLCYSVHSKLLYTGMFSRVKTAVKSSYLSFCSVCADTDHCSLWTFSSMMRHIENSSA